MAASFVEIPDPRLAVAPKMKKFEQVGGGGAGGGSPYWTNFNRSRGLHVGRGGSWGWRWGRGM